MLQAPPEADMTALLAPLTHTSSLTPASVAKAHEAWAKADAYYYRSIARMQRLWEVHPEALIVRQLLRIDGLINVCRLICQSRLAQLLHI